MNTAAFNAAQHRWDYMEPPEEPDIEKQLEIFDSIEAKARAARSAINRTAPRFAEAEGLAEEIRALCMQYPTGDTP